MKKSLVALSLAIICLVMYYVEYANIDIDTEHGASETLESLKMSEEESAVYEQALSQYDGVIINERLMTAFKKEFGEKDGFPARYPDNFAGTYLNEDSKLVIQISEDKDTKVLNLEYDNYIDVMKIKGYDNNFKADSISDVVVYERVKYSLNQLNDIMNNVIKILREDIPISGGHIDTLNNMIVLQLEQEVFDEADDIYEKIERYIRDEYAKKDIPLIIQPADVVQPDALCNVSPAANGEIEITHKEIGDEIAFETVDLKIISAEEKQLISSYYGSTAKPAEGAKFVLVVLELKNTTDKSFAFSPYLRLVDDKGGEFDSYPYTIGNIDNYIENRKLSPGIKEIGYLVYEIPANSEKYSIHSIIEDTNELYEIRLK